MRTGAKTTPHGYMVAGIKPFWRWAVAPANGGQAGIPYYRKASALVFLDEVRRELPWSPAVLLRKQRFRRVEVVRDA